MTKGVFSSQLMGPERSKHAMRSLTYSREFGTMHSQYLLSMVTTRARLGQKWHRRRRMLSLVRVLVQNALQRSHGALEEQSFRCLLLVVGQSQLQQQLGALNPRIPIFPSLAAATVLVLIARMASVLVSLIICSRAEPCIVFVSFKL